MKQSIKDLSLKGKKVLLRVDFNVPMKDGKITDDNRIIAALDTIKYIVEKGGKLILFSHLGKVKTEEDKKTKTLRPVAKRLSELLEKDVLFIDKTRGKELEDAINNMKDSDVLLFENTRFEKGETKNEKELGEYWASLGDVFVNDAFGTAHREHASNVGIASNLDSAVGFLMEKEIKFIGGVLENPIKPFVAILGGAKVSDKINVINHLMNISTKILIGGGMAYTFLKAKGYNVGKSLLEEDKIELAKEIMDNAKAKNVELLLPVDAVVSKEFSNDSEFRTCHIEGIQEDEMGLDIGLKTIELFKSALEGSKTVIWNGPMGVFEFSNYAVGTKEICRMLATLDATTIIGGGDSAAAAISMGYKDDFTHISTGGGASLKYLEGKELPGISSIKDKE